MSVNKKNIIVTGASGGIGYSIVEKLHAEGANILATGTREEKLNDLKNKFKEIKIMKFDISLHDKIEEFINLSTQELGGNLDCLENIKRIGSIGEIIEVKRGFARNFLIANNKALYASKENIIQVEKIKSELSKKDNEKKQQAKSIAEKINKKLFKIKKLSTENKELYGSVKPTEISKVIFESLNIEIKPSMIQPVKEIKSIGKFDVKISLHSQVDALVTIDVESAESIQ